VVDIVRFFDDHFEIVSADTPELIQEAYRLRFNFLSEELREPGYEAWRFPDGLEIDAFDEHSVQCLVRYKPTSVWAGSVRLVLAKPGALEAPLPVEIAAGSRLSSDRINGLDRAHLAEISRLILSEPFRHRHEQASADSLDSNDGSQPHTSILDRRHVQLPLLGLLAATIHLTVSNDVSEWLAAMEPSLARLLKTLGIEFIPIGPEISYHGTRRPYFGNVQQVMKTLRRRKPRIWEILSDGGRRYPPPKA
jgi:N-acyl amino acid synthase of PEP-CTERM/exosortase system